jgi:hypothetical protein
MPVQGWGMAVLRLAAFSEQSFRNCVIRALFRFYRIETGLWNFDLTRFLEANRYPLRLKTL